jgi:drug/metabolite transporter (DMT)-like permease
VDAVLLALLVGVLAGISNTGTRLALRRAPDVAAGSLLMTLVALLVALIVFGAVDREVGGWDDVWPYLAIGAVVPGVATILFVQAIRDAGVSRTGVLINTFPLFAVAFAMGLLDEPVRAGLVAGALLVVLGAAGLTLGGNDSGTFRGTAYRVGLVAAIVGAAFLGGRDVAVSWTGVGDAVPATLATALTLATGSVMILGFLLVRVAIDRRGGENGTAAEVGLGVGPRLRRAAVPFSLIGVLVGFGNVAIFAALERGPVTVVSPLIGTAALWTIVFSALVLGRADAINRRVVVSGLLVAAGVALIGVTRA